MKVSNGISGHQFEVLVLLKKLQVTAQAPRPVSRLAAANTHIVNTKVELFMLIQNTEIASILGW